MSKLARQTVVTLTSLGLVALGVACVDLFHSTDFETLCTRSPDDPLCGAVDGAVPKADVVVDAADAARPHLDFCAWTSAEAQTRPYARAHGSALASVRSARASSESA
jgi:hypothetical protein